MTKTVSSLLILTLLPFGEILMNGGNRDIVRQVIATQKPVVYDLQVGSVSKKESAALFFPVPAHGGKRYVVAQVFTTEFFNDAVSQRSTPLGWVVGIIGRDGRFIARNFRADERVGQFARAELTAAARASDVGVIRHQTLEGVESYDAFEHWTSRDGRSPWPRRPIALKPWRAAPSRLPRSVCSWPLHSPSRWRRFGASTGEGDYARDQGSGSAAPFQNRQWSAPANSADCIAL